MMLEVSGFALAALAAAYFLWDRYRPRPLRIDVDPKNTIVARLGSLNCRANGQIGIAFYNMRLVNVSRSSTTVQDLQLRWKTGQTTRATGSHVLLTGQVYAPLEKRTVDAAVVGVGGVTRVVLMGWSNLRARFADHLALEPGGVLGGSALFLLDTADFGDLKELSEVKLVLTDYRGRKSACSVNIDQELVDRGLDMVILDRSFSGGPDGSIVFT